MADEARIDKWLWAARIFKTRSIAADACKNGRVTIGGVNVKPSHVVKEGDVVAVRKPPVTYSFKILKTIEQRVGAKLLPEILKVLQQLFPCHDVVSEHRITPSHLVQGLYTNFVLDSPLSLHHALCIGIVVTYHLQVVLVQTLDSFYNLLLTFVRLGIILLSQRCTAMAYAHHKLRRLEWVEAQTHTERSCVESLAVELVHQFQQFFASL